MELDDLKKRWQAEMAAMEQQQRRSPEAIAGMLKGKTNDLFSRVRRKYQSVLNTLLGSMLLFTVVFPLLADAFTYPGSINGFTKCVFLYLVLIIFYWQKFKQVNNMELSDDISVRIAQLLKFARFSLRLEVIFTVVFLAGVIVLGRWAFRGRQGWDNPQVLAGLLIVLLFATVMLYLIISRHRSVIRELKTYLAEYDQVHSLT